MTKTIILIPSRLAATRLPNKPLLKINDISIINHVYLKAISSKIGDVFVATGDKEIFEEVRKIDGKCVLTEKEHQTGTDRIFEAYQKLGIKDVDYIINLQGDEPMIDIEDIKNLNNSAIKNKSEIATLACKIKDKKIFNKSNVVKVITDEKISMEKMSRANIFSRVVSSNDNSNIYHHIGIYIYKVSILKKFVNLKQSKNEIDQKLEQLRALDAGMKIGITYVENVPISVDTIEDLIIIENILKNKDENK